MQRLGSPGLTPTSQGAGLTDSPPAVVDGALGSQPVVAPAAPGAQPVPGQTGQQIPVAVTAPRTRTAVGVPYADGMWKPTQTGSFDHDART